MERDRRLAGLALVMVVVPLVFLALAPGAACAASSAVVGAAMLVSGAVARREEQRAG